MLRRPRAKLLLLIGFTLSFLSPAARAQAPPPDPSDEFTQQLDALVPKLLQKYKVPGAAVALLRNGAPVWTQGYGLAHEATGTAVTPDTVFQAASISKSVAAWGVLRLVEQGKLSLDAPVERYLTRWHLPPSDFDPSGVTIRRLLSHTAGLSLHGYPGFDPNQPLPSLEASLSGATNGSGDVRIVHEPGSQFSYSGGGYTLLQLLIEEVTGENFVTYMQRTVLAPLGMARSSYEWTPELKPATATAYRERGEPLPNYLFTAKAAAGLYTTASDLARFVAAGLPGPDAAPAGRGVLTPATLDIMFSPAPATQRALARDMAYGLGYETTTLPNGTRMVDHIGSNKGWRARFAALPDKGAGIVILTNSTTGRHIVVTDLHCAWSAWAADDTPRVCQTVREERTAVLGIAAILGAILGTYVWWAAAGIRSGRRRLGWSPAQTFPWRRLLRITPPLLAAALWWLFWYTALVPSVVRGVRDVTPAELMMPPEFAWVTLAVMLWCLVVTATGFLPPHQPPQPAELGDK